MMTRDVVTATSAEQERAIAVLTTAFSSDPVLRWVFPDAQQYLTDFPRLVRSFAGKAFENATAHQVDGFEGVALWLAPGIAPDEESMGAMLDERIAEERKEDLFAFLEQMGPYHPSEPHWYLPLIGVDPARQGKGHGSALLQYLLRTCDEQGSIAYLEASSSRNRPLYERHGFEAIGVIQVGSSPPMWPMVRKPR